MVVYRSCSFVFLCEGVFVGLVKSFGFGLGFGVVFGFPGVLFV